MIREEIVGSTAAALIQARDYADSVDLSGDEGTVTGICAAPGAPCAPLTVHLTVNGDLLILDGGAPPVSRTYRRIR